MAALATIFMRYNQQYLWFAPVIIAFLLILPLLIILIISIIRNKKAITRPTEEPIEEKIIEEPIDDQQNQQLEIKDIDLMSLTKAVETLIDEGQQKQITKGIGYDIEMQNDADRYYDPFVRLIARHVDIYGKRPSLSFNRWEIISEDMIRMGYFRKLGSELYFNKELLFIDLAIRQDELDKVIQRIMSEDRPFDWLSYEVKDL